MKLTCIQMDTAFADPDVNFSRARQLIAQAAQEQPDVILLPETWNTGFFPRERLAELSDPDCSRVIAEIGALAGQYGINIIAGSISCLRDGQIFNTACVFDRSGTLIARYDKAHLFSLMDEDSYYEKGHSRCSFTLDGLRCGLMICYDLRFPEFARSLALDGIEILFVVSQWPDARIGHMLALTQARAIENQIFVACCNACGSAGQLRFGGCSVIWDPLGTELARASDIEMLLSACCDPGIQPQIRSTIPVFSDRRVDLYTLSSHAPDQKNDTIPSYTPAGDI